MVLFLQLLTVALCGGFLFVCVSDMARTNYVIATNDRDDLTIQLAASLRRAEGYAEGYVSRYHIEARAAQYLLTRAEARVKHMKRWGF